MDNTIQTLENLPKIRVKLTVPLVASYLSKGYRITDIAKVCNQSHQWVSEFISKRYVELMPLLDNQDVISAMQAKYIAQRARNELENVFDTCKDFTKKDLIPLTAVSDRHTQQYRLLSDKSTQNISKEVLHTRMEDRNKQLKELQEIKAKMIGNVSPGFSDLEVKLSKPFNKMGNDSDISASLGE